MKYMINLIWLGLLLLGFIPGLNGIFLVEAAVAFILVGSATTLANAKGLIPGTAPYYNRVAIEQAQTGLELDRINRTRTRLKLIENQDIDRILALEPAKSDVA